MAETFSDGEPQSNLSGIDTLAAEKELAWNELGPVVSQLKSGLRKVAGVESRIATYLIASGLPDEAVNNLNSEAALLIRADEYAEALSVYRKALTYAGSETLQQSIMSAIARLEEAVMTLKTHKPIQPVVELVNRLGGNVRNAVEGNPGTERFVDFSYQGQSFKVAATNVWRLTTPEDQSGVDVTALERLEERVKEALAKADLSAQAREESDYEDDDEDYD